MFIEKEILAYGRQRTLGMSGFVGVRWEDEVFFIGIKFEMHF